MKKERFFRLLGDLDDHILDKYREMDAQLSHKALRKKRALRVLLIAACLALLIGACVPVGMLAHPAGRAILQGDSQALTEQLNGIKGFKPWQEQTAEKLEQSLSPELWESLQKTPVINVLTQSQYPDYAFKSMQYGAYLNEPEYLTYGIADSGGDYFQGYVDINAYGEEYQDPNATDYYLAPLGDSHEDYRILPYAYSMTQSLYSQAVHVYELNADKAHYTAYADARTGECVYWEISKASSHSPTVADEQTMIDAAYDILSQNVRDPEAYTLSTDRNNYYFICRYNRNIGDFESCDGVTVRFDLAGNVISVDMAYLGALRYLAEIPQELIDKVTVYMEQTVAGCIESETNIDNITVLSDGRIALACHMEVEYYDAQSDTRQGDATWFLACLTEPAPSLTESGQEQSGPRVLLKAITYWHDGSELKRTEYEYDAKGNMTRESLYRDGKTEVATYYTYRYDADDRLIEKRSYYVGDELDSTRMYEYDQRGLLVYEYWLDSDGEKNDGTYYEYDDQGREIRVQQNNSVTTCVYGENGSYVATNQTIDGTYITESVCDFNGNQISNRWIKDGEVLTESLYTYDDQNREISQTYHNYTTESTRYSEYEYSDGMIRYVIYKSVKEGQNAVIEQIITYWLNEYDEIVRYESTDGSGTVLESGILEYGYPNS